jgi:hypothetical protein
MEDVAMADRLPMTERCLLMLAMLGGEASTVQVRDGFMREVGEKVPTGSVRRALRGLATMKRPRVEVAKAGNKRVPTVWRLTAYGHEVLAEEDRARIPCGTGWPA